MLNIFSYVILLLLIFTTTFNRGFFSLPGFFIASLSYILMSILVYWLIIKNKRLESSIKDSNKFFRILLVFVYTLYLFFPNGIYQKATIVSLFLSLLPLLFYPLIISYVMPFPDNRLGNIRLRYFVLIALAFLVRILIIIASPEPTIDTYVDQKEAPLVLIRGINPYSITFPNIYKLAVNNNIYSYWPVSIFLQFPLVLLLHDPRFLHVFADIGGAILIYIIGRKSNSAELLSLVYLFRPNSVFIIEQSWLAPTLLFFSCLLVFLYIYNKGKRRSFLVGSVIGILTGIQVHYFLFAPLFFIISRNKKYIIWGILSVLSVAVIPFLIWNYRDFYAHTIGEIFNVINRPEVPIYMSLNLNTFYHALSGKNLPSFMMPSLLVFVLVLLLVSFGKLYKSLDGENNKHVTNYMLAMTYIFFTFYYFLPFTFINYYYFITGLFILSLSCSLNEEKGRIDTSE